MFSNEHWCVLIKHNEGKINHSCQLYLDSLAPPENKTRCNINKYNHGIHLSTNALCADYDNFFLLWSYLDQVLLANIMSQATSTFSPPWSPPSKAWNTSLLHPQAASKLWILDCLSHISNTLSVVSSHRLLNGLQATALPANDSHRCATAHSDLRPYIFFFS